MKDLGWTFHDISSYFLRFQDFNLLDLTWFGKTQDLWRYILLEQYHHYRDDLPIAFLSLEVARGTSWIHNVIHMFVRSVDF